MKSPISKALQDLKKTLENVESLSAWLELKRAENRHLPLNLQIPDTMRNDLKVEYGWFLKTADEIREVLSSMCVKRAKRFHATLKELEQRIHAVDLSESLE